jgi:hypothetical protein
LVLADKWRRANPADRQKKPLAGATNIKMDSLNEVND